MWDHRYINYTILELQGLKQGQNFWLDINLLISKVSLSLRHEHCPLLAFQPSRLPQNGYSAREKEGNCSWKNIKKIILLKKYQKLFTSQILFFMRAVCTAILSMNWKNNNTMFMVFQIQPMDNGFSQSHLQGFFSP